MPPPPAWASGPWPPMAADKQNRKAWTNHPGNRYTMQDVPAGVKEIKVYGWDGLRETIAVVPGQACVVKGLTPEQTYMFVAKH